MITALSYKPISDLSAYEQKRIEEIVRPYYVDAGALLKRALTHNNYIYLSYVDSVMAAFFMVAWEKLSINGIDYPSLFLGLGCADPAFRNRKLVSTMYKQSVVDVADWQTRYSQDLVVWFTTATPIVWHIMNKTYQLIQPNPTGCLSEQVMIAQAIRQHHYPYALPATNPFVLKGVATATQYAPAETTYLAQGISNEPTIFEQLGIDEPSGDRLLVLCTLPSDEVIENHRQALKNLVVQLVTTL